MNVYTHKSLCSGCTACASVCPKKCIVMKEDYEGFLYPEIDENKCVKCNLCKSVCPVVKKYSEQEYIQRSYAIRSLNNLNLMSSTSGGIFYPIANYIRLREGVIFAASYTRDFYVEHIGLDFSKTPESETTSYTGSKYVQSRLGDTFSKIRKILQEDRLVCFIGTPCQVQGLKSYLREKNDNLITIDLVCHGTPSPKLWRKYLAFQVEKHNSSIKSISFRSKKFGYHSGGIMDIHFQNGLHYYGSARVDYMLKAFFNEIASRPICYKCPFKSLARCSDLTIYDCWHFEKLTGLKDDDKGYTNVIVQSAKGQELLDNIQSEIKLYDVETDLAINLDGDMVDHCAIPHPKRDEFYKEIDSLTMDDLANKYIPISLLDYCIEYGKRVLYELGIMQIIKSKRL